MTQLASGFSASHSSSLHYHLLTRSTVQVLAQVGLNEVQTDARVSVLSADSSGRTMQVEQVAFRPRAQDPTTLLLAELNTLQKCLVLSTDAYGELTGLRNHADVQARWAELRPRLLRQFRQVPDMEPLLATLDQQVDDPALMLAGLRHKGLYGILFAGFHGHPVGSEFIRSRRVIGNFFNGLDLPLQLMNSVLPHPDHPADRVVVEQQGQLDQLAFDGNAFRRLIRLITDDATFRVNLYVRYEGRYELDARSGDLLGATQTLRAEVPGAYLADTQHTLTLTPTPNA